MESAFEKQDNLIKTLHDFDVLEASGIIPERTKINSILLILIWVLAILFMIVEILINKNQVVLLILGSTIFITIPLVAAIKNKKWGFYALSVACILLSADVTYTEPNYYSPLVSFCDALFLFIIVNQFGKKSYTLCAPFFMIKMFVTYFLFNSDQNIGYFFTSIVTILAVGAVPILIQEVSQNIRKLKKSEVRAEILALQNQELLATW